jgi:hypothetical protein
VIAELLKEVIDAAEGYGGVDDLIRHAAPQCNSGLPGLSDKEKRQASDRLAGVKRSLKIGALAQEGTNGALLLTRALTTKVDESLKADMAGCSLAQRLEIVEGICQIVALKLTEAAKALVDYVAMSGNLVAASARVNAIPEPTNDAEHEAAALERIRLTPKVKEAKTEREQQRDRVRKAFVAAARAASGEWDA